MLFSRRTFAAAVSGGLLSFSEAASTERSEDWPEWRGTGRVGRWNQPGALTRFPANGPRILWRTPIHSGYAGPSVAAGRVFVTDYKTHSGLHGTERAVALDQRTGNTLWQREWDADYAGLDYASGPRATPTVDGDRVYVLGAAGDLLCLNASDGALRWSANFPQQFDTELPPWGTSSAPLIVGDLLIAVVAGRPDAKVVAFDKISGKEVWRALSSKESGPGYSQPLLIDVDGRPQVIVWHSGAVSALSPQTGELLWNQPFQVRMETPIATPVWSPPHLLVSAFFNGSRLFRLSGRSCELLWKGESDSAISTDGLHSLMASPIIGREHVYGICSFGQLRCLSLATGRRVWESQAVTVEKARNASAFLVRNGDRYWINNDRGELILARLSPQGYEEIDRAKLIQPTSKPGARRELGAVNWSHPAYAGKRIYARNDHEILCADLTAR